MTSARAESVDETAIVRARDRAADLSWPLTELDAVCSFFVIRGAWVFDRELDAACLQAGLERVLCSYPHVAGRMAGNSVRLDNSGVPFTVSSRRSIGVEDVSADPSLAHRRADRIRPSRLKRGREPFLKVRLTRLRDGSLLNVCCSHVCLDGNGFYTFVRNWGWSCAGRPFTAVLAPSLVPPALECSRATALERALARGWEKVSWWTIARMVARSVLGRLGGRLKVARFSAEDLRRLRRAARREASRPTLRTFEALSAHLTRMCIRLVGLPAGTRCSQVTVLDARGRVPSLPPDYVGNAAFPATSAGFDAAATLGEIARSIHDGLDPFLTIPSTRLVDDLALARAIVRHRLLVTTFDAAAMHASRPTLTYINNFWGLPIYDVDFGEPGAPIVPRLVVPHDLPDPVLIWPAPPERGGVEVYFAGTYARAVRRLSSDHPWWTELRAGDSIREEAG